MRAMLLVLCLPALLGMRWAIVDGSGNVLNVVRSAEAPPVATGHMAVALGDGDRAEPGGTYSDGVFTPGGESVEAQIQAQADAAIATNKAFLAIQGPTSGQAITQLQELSRQNVRVMRYLLRKFDAVE